VLELAVVVVGIFLGLQVDDWNERRKDLQLETRYLDKLRTDLSTMRDGLHENIDNRKEAIQRISGALTALEECSASDQARFDLDFALERYQITGQFQYLNATYDEMVASGALARIDDHELKQEITYTFSQLEDRNNDQRNMRISMPVVDSIVWKTVSYSVDRGTGRPSVSYDFDKLCGNVELRNAVVEMIDMQWDVMAGAERALESVDKVIASLDKGVADSFP